MPERSEFQTTAATEREIMQLEEQRCHALIAGNVEALAKILDDDVVYVHSNGKVDDKSGYLSLVDKGIRYLEAERRELRVRVAGTCAIASGILDQRVVLRATGEEKQMRLVTTQVWLLLDGHWRLSSFQATNV